MSAGRLTEPQGCEVDPTLAGVAVPSRGLKERTWPVTQPADRQALVEVINLGLLWHCLCAITRLEVPERLAAGPLPIPQLAQPSAPTPTRSGGCCGWSPTTTS